MNSLIKFMNAKKITRHDIARTASARWLALAFGNDGWYDASYQSVFYNLLALGTTPDPDRVNAVVGTSFADLSCDFCSASVNEAVVIDNSASDALPNLYVCKSCAQKLLEAFNGDN